MLRIRRIYALLLSLGAAAVVAACAVESTSPSAPAAVRAAPDDPNMLLGLPLPALGFVTCQAQPYAASTVAIGPAGGTIQVNNHRLTVPAGALDSTVVITMEAPSDTIRSVRFSPAGLTFDPAHPPRLRMSYANCSLLSLVSKRIVYTDEQWNLLERLLTLDLPWLLGLEADVGHFSRYAIHY